MSALDLPPIPTEVLARVEEEAVALGITRDQMTEAAARAAAAMARKLLDNRLEGSLVVGLIGGGVKAAVALNALRILHGFGAEVAAVMAVGPGEMRPATRAAVEVLEALRVPLHQPRSPAVRGALADAGAVIDGLVGVGIDGALREPHAALVRLANEVQARALAIEVPSGLEPDSGDPLQPTLRARSTLALGLPAQGLYGSLAWQYTGEVWLCDVGYPPEALEAADLDGEGLFTDNELVRLR